MAIKVKGSRIRRVVNRQNVFVLNILLPFQNQVAELAEGEDEEEGRIGQRKQETGGRGPEAGGGPGFQPKNGVCKRSECIRLHGS